MREAKTKVTPEEIDELREQIKREVVNVKAAMQRQLQVLADQLTEADAVIDTDRFRWLEDESRKRDAKDKEIARLRQKERHNAAIFSNDLAAKDKEIEALKAEIDADGVWIDKAIDQKLKCERLQADLAAAQNDAVDAYGRLLAAEAREKKLHELNDLEVDVKREQREEIARLREALSAVEKENVELRKEIACVNRQTYDSGRKLLGLESYQLQINLEASKERERKLREVLEKIANPVTHYDSLAVRMDIARQALEAHE